MLSSLSSAIKTQKNTSQKVSEERFDHFFSQKVQQIKFFDARVNLMNSLNSEQVEKPKVVRPISGITVPKSMQSSGGLGLTKSASEYKLKSPAVAPSGQDSRSRLAWKPRPDVVLRATSVKNIRTIKQKQNLNIFTQLENKDQEILKLRILKDEIRGLAAAEETATIVADRECKGLHWRVHLKQQHRDKLCRELQELNNKFAKVSKEVGLLSTHLENVKQQYKITQECIAGITLTPA